MKWQDKQRKTRDLGKPKKEGARRCPAGRKLKEGDDHGQERHSAPEEGGKGAPRD